MFRGEEVTYMTTPAPSIIHLTLVEIVFLIVLQLCFVVLGHPEIGEKLQRVACRGEVVDRNFVV